MFKKIFMAILGVGLAASFASANDGADKIINACIMDAYDYHWHLDINNQSPYSISGEVHDVGCVYTVTGNATAKNGDVVSATTFSTTTDTKCCSWISYWSMNIKTKTGSYTWVQSGGPLPGCTESGGPASASVVACTAAEDSGDAGPGAPATE